MRNAEVRIPPPQPTESGLVLVFFVVDIAGQGRYTDARQTLFATPNDAIAKAVQVVRGGRSAPASWRPHEEPSWFDPSVFLTVAAGAALTNSLQLSAVLGTIPASFGDLRILRNYFAHRNEDLRTIALAVAPSYLLSTAVNPSDLLRHIEPGRTVSVIERWIIEIRRTAMALCQ